MRAELIYRVTKKNEAKKRGSKFRAGHYYPAHFESNPNMSRSKFWCFTVNNPTAEDNQRVADFLGGTNVSYGIVGRENAPTTGTPHLQGYLILVNSQRRSYLLNNLSPRGSYRSANGTPEHNRAYCSKDGDFDEYGEIPQSNQGRRNDLDELIEWIDQFTADNGRPPISPDFAAHKPKALVRYPRLVRVAALRAPPRQLEFGEPREWQRNLAEKLSQPADDRSVDFVIDSDGGKGKSWFCRWMLTNNPDSVQVVTIGKKDDIAYALDERKHIVLFNVPRGQMEYLSYPLLEGLKDRMVMSGKYSSAMKYWNQKVHVVVLGNEEPDYEKMTGDRYNVITID